MTEYEDGVHIIKLTSGDRIKIPGDVISEADLKSGEYLIFIYNKETKKMMIDPDIKNAEQYRKKKK